MVENSTVQLRLRAHMYGIKDLPHLALSDSSQQHIPKHVLNVLINTHYRKEYNTDPTFHKITRQLQAGRQVVDVQNGAIMVDTGRKCYFEVDGQRSRSVQRTMSQTSTFTCTWCFPDKVVVEAQG